MTRFKDLDEEQQSAVSAYMLRVLERRISDDMHYASQTLRLLLLGNAAGVALLATFMGTVAATGSPISGLVGPLWKFFIGSVLVAVIYGVSMPIASQALAHSESQVLAFVKNEIDLENMRGYGFNKAGRAVVRILATAAFGFFMWGVVQCISLLEAL